MDGTQPGELGVIAWCNTIRFDMAKDPGLAFLSTQIKEKGFDFLDSYLENIVSRPTEGRVYELLKTPGRKKDAPKRTRAATAAAAAKAALVASDTLLEPESTEEENVAPVNDFHKALLDAKNVDDDDKENADTSLPNKSPHEPFHKEVDEHSEDQPTKTTSVMAEMHAAKNENISKVDHLAVKDEATSIATHVSSVATPPASSALKTATANVPEATDSILKVEAPMELSIIAEDEEERSRLSLQPGDDDMDIEIVVPIKDEDTTINTLNRKPSISHFGGLPAPSPLRKSTRLTREPSTSAFVAPGLSHTPGAGLGGKRTSWLTKAKEAKALEMTDSGKKKSTLTGLGIVGVGGGSGSRKRKSEDMHGELSSAPSSSSAFSEEDDERKVKSARLAKQQDDTGSLSSERTDVHSSHSNEMLISHLHGPDEDFTVPLRDTSPEEGALDRFKKTVEGMGARSAKSIGKSLGGGAAAALAEARAAAEARVAQRNKEENGDVSMDASVQPSESTKPASEATSPTPQMENATHSERRLSMSDLVTPSEDKPSSSQPTPPSSTATAETQVRPSESLGNASISTTPPHSPPPPKAEVKAPPPAVFTKPVFVAPPPNAVHAPRPETIISAAGSSKEFSFKLPDSKLFTRPIASTLGVPAPLPSTSSHTLLQPTPALSAQTSKASIFSDAIFDKEDDIPAWMPSTQDTDYSLQPSQTKSHQEQLEELENEDPAWPLEDKFTANNMWTPYGFASGDRDDTMSTYSTVASQKGDTGPLLPTQSFNEALEQAAREHAQTMTTRTALDFDPAADNAQANIDEADLAMNVDTDDVDSELEEILLTGKSTISLVEPKQTRSESQMSMASTSSSQSQLGFFGQATKLVSSYLGGKKNKAEPVKSIQLAAAAAKKQQGEADKKAARLKEMENRRQLALQRKADEEKARAIEEERKIKEETERRKREREEHTDKRPLRTTTKKVDEDPAKKRKVTVEIEKKPETKKPPSRDQPSRLGKPSATATPGSKPVLKSAMKQPSSSHLGAASSSNTKEPTRQLKPTTSTTSLKSTAKGKAKVQPMEEPSQPSQVLQSQMAHRAKAHMQAVEPRAPPTVTSESIELPDINSEYSDSEDEDRPKTFDPPEWAQSPELRQALQQQSTMNPDAIFGRIGPLRMEEIFRTRQSRFRARTSSANWSGVDQLTAHEEQEYARRMGFR